MRKLAILLALVGGAVGFPSLAMAVDVVSVICEVATISGTPQYLVFQNQASAGVTLPASCAVSQTSSCSQCLADLLASGFTLKTSFEVEQFPLFVLKRGGGN
jgi:hypothetical protein